jgi:hypothetical protein
MSENKEKEGGKDELRQVQYLPDEEGKFKSEVHKVMAYNEYWDLQYAWQDKEYADGLAKMISGELSPIGLYITILDMSVPDTAARVGLSQRKVKRHMTAAGFRSASVDHLARYAEVFGVPVAAFFCFAAPGLPALPVSVEGHRDGMLTILKPGEISNEWNFLRTPAGRTL